MRRAPLILCVLGLAARAQGLALTWDAPETCPSGDELRRMVLAHVHAPAKPVEGFSVRARVAPLDGGRWRLSLETWSRAGRGERTLEGGDCREVAEAGALVVALALEEATQERPPLVVQPLPAPPGRSWAYLVRPSYQSSLLGLPRPASSVGLTLGARTGAWRGELSGSYGWAQLVSGGPRPGSGGEIGLPFTSDLRVCRLLDRGAVEPLACAGAEAGLVTGRGVGVSAPASGGAPVAGGTLLVGVSARLTRTLWVHLDLSGAFLAVRPQFVIQESGDGVPGVVYQTPWFVPAAALGVEARFP